MVTVRSAKPKNVGSTPIFPSIIMFFLLTTIANADILIGFKGKHGQFDHKAFNELAAKKKLKPVIANETNQLHLNNLIQNNNYELYGYSRGAAIVSYVVRMVHDNNMNKPKFVTTVGAYKTTDVDFRKYNIKFKNYFDHSGRGQRSPGIFVNVPHDKIMRYVTDNWSGSSTE
jgi:hypothetical protein